MISFTAILWNLSGTLNIFGVSIPRAMFWTVLVYVFVATVISFIIGRPLIWLSFRNEKLNAAFRYALVRLRDAAEAVGFYRGERVEGTQLQRRFTPVIDNYRRYVRRSIAFNGWNLSVSQTIVPLPWVIQAPRLFAGQIDFGDVGQTATSFGNIHDSLSFFRNNYDAFASFRAAIIRLHGLVDANEKGRALPAVLTRPSDDESVELNDIEVRTPAGDRLIDPLDVRLDRGGSLVITGRSGAGKTTLLRSLAELWPYASGTLHRPGGENETMFLSQLPYVPLGTLRDVVCYPNSAAAIPDATLRDTLTKVALAPLCDRLDEERDWAKVLSPVSSNVLPLLASCSPNPRRSSSTKVPRRWTPGWSLRSTNCCAASCRTASWSASAIAPPSSGCTKTSSNYSVAANGGWPQSRRRPPKCKPGRASQIGVAASVIAIC